MRNKLVYLSLLLVVATIGTGCCSTTIDSWADRGTQGLIHGQQNIEEFAQKIQDNLDKNKSRDIDAIFADILAVGSGEIEGVEIDEAWVKAHKAALLALMGGWDRDQDALDQAMKDSLDNLEQIAECFQQIKRLRSALSPTEEMQARLDYLTALVTQLIQKEK